MYTSRTSSIDTHNPRQHPYTPNRHDPNPTQLHSTCHLLVSGSKGLCLSPSHRSSALCPSPLRPGQQKAKKVMLLRFCEAPIKSSKALRLTIRSASILAVRPEIQGFPLKCSPEFRLGFGRVQQCSNRALSGAALAWSEKDLSKHVIGFSPKLTPVRIRKFLVLKLKPISTDPSSSTQDTKVETLSKIHSFIYVVSMRENLSAIRDATLSSVVHAQNLCPSMVVLGPP